MANYFSDSDQKLFNDAIVKMFGGSFPLKSGIVVCSDKKCKWTILDCCHANPHGTSDLKCEKKRVCKLVNRIVQCGDVDE